MLHKGRQQGKGGVKRCADNKDVDKANDKISVGEHARLDKWVFGTEHVDEKHIEKKKGSNSLNNDFPAGEPIERLAAIKQQLQRPDGQSEEDKTKIIEAPAAVQFAFGYRGHNTEKGDYADGKIDIEDPAPVIVFGKIATQRWPDDRPDHYPQTPYRHGRAMSFTRIGVEKHRLGKRYKTGTEDALQ